MHKKFPDSLYECCSSQYQTQRLDSESENDEIYESFFDSLEFFLARGPEFAEVYSSSYTMTEKFLFKLGFFPYRKRGYENCQKALEIFKK